MTSRRAFLGVLAIVFAASAAGTIAMAASMSAMGEMSMPGGWTTSHVWMVMPGQSLLGATASFVGMWTVMMAAMMLPSLTPTLVCHHDSLGRAGVARPGCLTALVGVGYFTAWATLGAIVFLVGVKLAETSIQGPASSRAVHGVLGAVVILGGLVQQTNWKARHLARCRYEIGRHLTLPASLGPAWTRGLRLGFHCTQSCTAITAVLLALGMMDLRVMASVAALITVERIAPNGVRAARISGLVAVTVGIAMIGR